MGGWISKNSYLSQGQMQNNAQNVYAICRLAGWDTRPVCAMLGNMVAESNINPGIYENLRQPYKGQAVVNWGYGLVQWTPAQKLFNWCYENNLDYRSGDVQMKRIIMEWNSTRDRYAVGKFVQWSGPRATDSEGRIYCPYTFYDFSHDTTSSMRDLVYNFMRWYERPKVYTTLDYRTHWANSMYMFLSGNQGTFTPTPGQLSEWVLTSRVPGNNEYGMIPYYYFFNSKFFHKKGR